jgi:hypothetical protein
MRFPEHLRKAIGLLVAAASLFGTTWSYAQSTIVVKPLSASGATPSAVQALVNNLLGGSSGIQVVPGSIQYTGAPSASGLFIVEGLNGIQTLGVGSGVVLTTGDARYLSGSAAFSGDVPNKAVVFTSGANNSLTRNTAPGSPLFASVTPVQTFNASILSFQFIPTGSTITMSYVFASEDYNDLVNTGYPTDAIAVLVNGVNYAVVPGTSTPVSAASINCGGPTSGPENNLNPKNCNLYRDNPSLLGSINTGFDGLTVSLPLTAPVLAGQVNTIQIGIANGGDTFGDSALLLQGGSLSSSP